jgi:uncharacterized membrane protein HdeD (DUF308 family)
MPNRISFSKIMLYFGLLMILLYIVAGSVLIFAQVLPDSPKQFKVIFGIFFVLYGIFRFARVYPKLKNRNQDEDND